MNAEDYENCPDFVGFRKIPRLSREIVITEKIDGTNAQIYIGEDGVFMAGSRNRWITPHSDNAGFARWAEENKEELMWLGPGHHYGEWWGQGIQRNYGLDHKCFSLFNVGRFSENRPPCTSLVPVLYEGMWDHHAITNALTELRSYGSKAAPGFMRPEGIVIYHKQGNVYFKKTLEGDEVPKSKNVKG